MLRLAPYGQPWATTLVKIKFCQQFNRVICVMELYFLLFIKFGNKKQKCYTKLFYYLSLFKKYRKILIHPYSFHINVYN